MATDILRPAETAPVATDFLKDYHGYDDHDHYDHDYDDHDQDDHGHDYIGDSCQPCSGSVAPCRSVSASNSCVAG